MQTIKCPHCGKRIEYQSTSELAAKIKRTPVRVRQLLQEGRVPGAIKVGLREYLIPAGAENEIAFMPHGNQRGFKKKRSRK